MPKRQQTYTIKIYMVGQTEPIERELSFCDYISLMWSIKSKAFVALWSLSINKMHILKIDVEMSPHVAMSVNDFIHEQKDNAFKEWLTWEELYNRRCESLSILHMRNRRFTLNKDRDGD